MTTENSVLDELKKAYSLIEEDFRKELEDVLLGAIGKLPDVQFLNVANKNMFTYVICNKYDTIMIEALGTVSGEKGRSLVTDNVFNTSNAVRKIAEDTKNEVRMVLKKLIEKLSDVPRPAECTGYYVVLEFVYIHSMNSLGVKLMFGIEDKK